MSNRTARTAPSEAGCHDLRVVQRPRGRETPLLGAARTHLLLLAQDLRKSRLALVALVRVMRTTEPNPADGHYPEGPPLSVEEWAADCADAVAEGLDNLAQLAETFAQADWHADVSAWIQDSSKTDGTTRAQR